MSTRKGFLLEREGEWVVRDKTHLILLLQKLKSNIRTKHLRFTVESFSSYSSSFYVNGRIVLDCSGDEHLVHRNDMWKKDKLTGCAFGFYTTPEFKDKVLKEVKAVFGPDSEPNFVSDVTAHKFSFQVTLAKHSQPSKDTEPEDPHDPTVLNLHAPTKSQQRHSRRSRRWL